MTDQTGTTPETGALPAHGAHAAGAHAGPRLDDALEASVGEHGSHEAGFAPVSDRGSESPQDVRAADPPTEVSAGQGDAKWWTLVAVCAGVFILLLDITIVNVALPDIQSELDASLSDLQWVIDAYALSLAALLLTAGSLADLFGRRLVFVIGTLIFAAGSIACGVAQDVLFLQLARAFQGIGGAAMFATALALIASAFSGRDRGVAFGAFGATTGVAVALGPVLGGVLTSYLSWRWIFFVNLPICAAAIVIGVWRVKESHDPRAGRPDWFGFLTFSLALAGLVYALIRAGQTSWGDGRVLACLIAAAVLMVAFVVLQTKQSDPMFDLSLLRNPTFVGGLIAAFGVSSSVFAMLAYLTIYVQNVLDYSAVDTGVRFLFLTGMAFVAAAIAGRLTEKVPTKWLISPGFALVAIGLFLMAGIHTDYSWTHLIPGLIISGIGIGMINTPLASTAVGVVPVAQAGMASGINSTFRQVGIATGVATLGSILSQHIAHSVRDGLAGTPAASRSDQVAGAVTGGQIQQVIAGAPGAVRDQLAQVATSAYVDALNDILYIGAVVAAIACLLTLVLIRQKDFVAVGGPPAGH